MAGLEEILARLLVPDNAVIQQVCVLERLKLKLSSALTGHCLLAMPSCFRPAGMKKYAMLCAKRCGYINHTGWQSLIASLPRYST